MLLPRIQDAVNDSLECMAACGPDESCEYIVIDLVDAFWQLPLNRREQAYVCAKLRD